MMFGCLSALLAWLIQCKRYLLARLRKNEQNGRSQQARLAPAQEASTSEFYHLRRSFLSPPFAISPLSLPPSVAMPPPNMFIHLRLDGKCALAQLAPLTHEAPASRAAWRNSLEASAGGASPWSLAHLTPEAFCGLLQAPPGACPSGRASPLPPRAAPTHAARELSTGHLPALTSARRSMAAAAHARGSCLRCRPELTH